LTTAAVARPPLTARFVRFFGHGGGVAFALIGAILAVSALSAWLFAHAVGQRLQRDVARLILSDNTDVMEGMRWSVESAEQALERAQRAVDAAGDRAYIVVSIEDNHLWYRKGEDVLFSAPVATGSGKTLVGSSGNTYRFDTPRGRLSVQSKETDPVWSPPDWHYEERAHRRGLGLLRLQPGQAVRAGGGVVEVEGDAVVRVGASGERKVLTPDDGELVVDGKLVVPPLGTSLRRHTGVLGTHRLNLGDGYALHGTDQPDSVGRSVSHGCVRLRNEDIARLFDMVPVGTAVYIY
jgi:lipoprotein-anchoring transpeptidase ErfK/SrfK